MNARLVTVGLVCALAAPALASQPAQMPSAQLSAAKVLRTLSFEERVAAQAAIERAYYSHQIGAKKAFEDAVPRDLLVKKVERYLEESAVLASQWNTPITDEVLQREVERMARGTRMPERLLELYAALGNDPFVVKECLARAAVADRLAHNFYAFDPTLQVKARERADELRRRLVLGRLDPNAELEGRSVVTWTVLEAGAKKSQAPAGGSEGVPSATLSRRWLTPEEFQTRREELPRSVGAISPIAEEREGFAVRVVLSETSQELRVATYIVPKTTWDAWWKQIRASLPANTVAVAASTSGHPPAPRRLVAGVGGLNTRGADALPCPGDDTWTAGILDDVPTARIGDTAIWTGSVMVIWGGDRSSSFDYATASGGRYDPATDTWAPTSMVGAPVPRAYHASVWTGNEMLVWGGITAVSRAFAVGGRYDPVADTWSSMSAVGGPLSQGYQVAVWTGSKMVVWGGYDDRGWNSGGSYDPQTDTWIEISTLAAPSGRIGHSAIWTGHLMVVWGGDQAGDTPYDPAVPVNTGGAYDPAADTWTPLSTTNAPDARDSHTAIWTGTKMVVWGGRGYVGDGFMNTGGQYDPETDTWSATSMVGAPEPRADHTAVWTGRRMIVWGGHDDFQFKEYDTGAGYDPETDSWVATSTAAAPHGRFAHTAVWTGRLMVVWGGATYFPEDMATGGRYDPSTDTWTPTASAPWAREGHAAVWTGSVMIIFGGTHDGSGSRYDPVADTWSPTSTAGALFAPDGFTAVWTGHLMLVWGGRSFFPAGARYDPIADSWSPISTVDAPRARSNHTAVWTGSRMVIWGGASVDGGLVNSGSQYDPESDSWVQTSMIGAPSGRWLHTAVWTGKEMIIWGGIPDRAPPLATGGRYDPAADRWAPTSTNGAPTGRAYHTAIWTGHEMVVWGGSHANELATGARYDPSSDTWAATSMTSAPDARLGHTAVWTGKLMIVWGGDPALATGGRYDPASDRWTSTSLVGAPAGRILHTAVWTGRSMIVWGGQDATTTVNNGGIYSVCSDTAPTADAGPNQVLECQGNLSANATLDGSASTDPDSTPGTSDDIVSYAWTEGVTPLATGEVTTAPLSLGPHTVTLTVTDKAGATGTDDTLISVQDTKPPVGAIVAPAARACFGPTALPVTVKDIFTDVCDPTVLRSYDPAPGPSYSQHGDYHVTLTAKDTSGNAATSAIDFTIDTKPPVVQLLAPADGTILLPRSVGFSILFHDSDDDGATGGVVHEVIKLQGCVIFDGLTYGNKDGLLSDETLTLGSGELCRAAQACGFTTLTQPVLSVEATDCGGNVGVASHQFAGSVALRPGICGR